MRPVSKVDFKSLPMSDFIVVQMEQEPATTIKLPDWQRILRGEVIAVGPGRMLSSGARAPMACEKGNRITFAATAGMDSVFQGAPVRLMHDSDVDAVIA